MSTSSRKTTLPGGPERRCRVRELGLSPGVLQPGNGNAITDVMGVRVGHVTLVEGTDVRTGVTAILPHSGNLYAEKIPAGLAVGNGYGKFTGSTQLIELGEIETPILLTNTLAVPRAAEAIVDWILARPGNEEVVSVNPIVGETNDGRLNDIRRHSLAIAHMHAAIESATGGSVAEGCVGAGTGTVCFGWKGGIGTSSRRLPDSRGGFTVGALVQSNFGGILKMDGLPIGAELGQDYPHAWSEAQDTRGSIMIILATDAPLSDHSLVRLANRGLSGLARTGAAMSSGSGDYAVAFSVAREVRRCAGSHAVVREVIMHDELMSLLFLAAIEASEEAIYNSLCMASTMTGYRGRRVEALPLDKLRAIIHRHRGKKRTP